MNISEKKRIDEIDIIKAFTIILMVASHSGAPFSEFVFLFHMPVFFIVSGFLYKEQYSLNHKTLTCFIINRIKRLWMPFFCFNLIFVLFHNFFISINLYTTDTYSIFNNTTTFYSFFDKINFCILGLYLHTNEELIGGFWFLRILFYVSIFYTFLDYVIRIILNRTSLLIQLYISSFFLTISYFLTKNKIFLFDIPQILSCYSLFFLGRSINFFNIFEKLKKIKFNVQIFLSLTAFFFLYYFNSIGHIDLEKNDYPSPMFMLLSSSFGLFIIFEISFYLNKTKYIKKIMCCIGKRTLSILILHYLCMKIIVYIIISIYHYPLIFLASFPHLNGGLNGWWILYTLCGIVLPVLLRVIFDFIYYKVMVLLKKIKISQTLL